MCFGPQIFVALLWEDYTCPPSLKTCLVSSLSQWAASMWQMFLGPHPYHWLYLPRALQPTSHCQWLYLLAQGLFQKLEAFSEPTQARNSPQPMTSRSRCVNTSLPSLLQRKTGHVICPVSSTFPMGLNFSCPWW